MEAGYDLSKLPRGPNGELLRGPNGGIALVSPEERARIERERSLEERRAEIMSALQQYADKELSNEEFLNVIDLQEEHLRIQQDLGLLEIDETQLSSQFEYFRFIANHTTADGRIPTAKASEFMGLVEKLGSNIPELRSLLPLFRESIDAAKKNGDVYFQPRLESITK